MSNPKFRLFKDQRGYYRFTLDSINGEPILHATEGYSTKQACQTGIASVKVNAPIESRYTRSQATNGQFYFTLSALNGEKIGMSEMYISSSSRDNGINAVKRDAPNAPTVDLT